MSNLWKQDYVTLWQIAFNASSTNIAAKVANTKSKKENFLIQDDKWIWNDLHASIKSVS